MRRLVPLFAVLVTLSSCRGGGGGGSATPSPTPGPPAEREEVFLQLDVALAAKTDPSAILGGKMERAESLSGGVRWRPVAAAMPVLARAANAVTADAYEDPGYLTVAFRGAAAAAPALLEAELGALLSAAASKPEARGAALYLLDDRDGSVAGVLGIAGHDAAEGAMALLDVWAPQLELSYAPEGLAGEGEVDRARLTEALRALPDVAGDLKRAPGATFMREAGAVRVTFAAGADTRSLAATLVARLGPIAAPVVVTTGGAPAQP